MIRFRLPSRRLCGALLCALAFHAGAAAAKEPQQDSSSAPHVVVMGIEADGTIIGPRLIFKSTGRRLIDARASSMTIFRQKDGSNQVIDLAFLWRLEPRANRLVIDADRLRPFVEKLPDGALTIDFALTSEDGEWGCAGYIPISKPKGSQTRSKGWEPIRKILCRQMD